MAPKFGTSGLRGLEGELTDDLCARYTRAFLAAMPEGPALFVGRDLRPSSERIAGAVIGAAAGAAAGATGGRTVFDCGTVPTPALALAAMRAGAPAVMVTGSHIPAGRNGLKFFGPLGGITKADEAAIAAGAGAADGSAGAEEAVPFDAVTPYLARYTGFFAADALGGLRVGVFEQSTVAREILRRVLEALGAEVVAFGRSEAFVAVDTEAVDAGMRALIRDAAEAQGLDAVVSADGDGDRPLLADGSGEILAGDILGALTAMALGADTVVTPVSSNTLIERSGAFRRVVRTRIGSPYVIAGMEAAAPCRPAGFEANGGFLLGFKAERAGRTLEPLPTRDAVLPILSALALARERGGVGRLLEGLPPRRTAADRLADVPGEASRALVAALAADRAARARFFAGFGPEDWTDLTDGLRIGFGGGLILHLRPSGNAPELRVHAEADGADLAARAMREAMARVAARLGRERG